MSGTDEAMKVVLLSRTLRDSNKTPDQVSTWLTYAISSGLISDELAEKIKKEIRRVK